MKSFGILRLVSILVLLSALAAAQSQTADGPVRGPDGGTSVRVQGIRVLPEPNHPFSARDHIVWTRTLEDGTTLKTEIYALVARDSEGRIFRERRHFVPLNSEQKPPVEILQFDPVAHTRTSCNPKTKRCTISGYYPTTKFSLNPDGLLDHGTKFLSRANLGTNTIDGIDVNGTRETLQIAGGVLGNNQVISMTRDFWYSPVLGVNLAVERKDPRWGMQEIQLVDLSMTDPDPQLFQVPEGWTIQRVVSESESANN